MSKYKTLKVFDCQDMPEDVRKTFFDLVEGGNDCYIDWDIANEGWTHEGIVGARIIDNWLIANGADGPSSSPDGDVPGEYVLIRCWWFEYRITGFAETFRSPEYSAEEANYQRDDIAGYEGVEYAIIVPAKSKND